MFIAVDGLEPIIRYLIDFSVLDCYHYLSKLFVSNGTLLDQTTKSLLRKRLVFRVEMVVAICYNDELLVYSFTLLCFIYMTES